MSRTVPVLALALALAAFAASAAPAPPTPAGNPAKPPAAAAGSPARPAPAGGANTPMPMGALSPLKAPRIPNVVSPAAAGTFTSVTLHVFNRIFPEFHDQVEAGPKKAFRVGDTEYQARILEFVPDFSMNLKTHQIVSRSREPRNPAFRIAVTKGSAPVDTSWAFFNMPPHFGARNVLAFVATRITFPDRPPLESNDSLAVRIRQHEGGAH